jgi:RNA polymerase sigma-70 factor, ECF subfamily
MIELPFCLTSNNGLSKIGLFSPDIVVQPVESSMHTEELLSPALRLNPWSASERSDTQRPVDTERRRDLFYRVIWPEAPAVLRVARILTGGSADAEDLVQETLLKAFRALQTFDPGTKVRAWLLAILRNARIDRLRAGRPHERDVSLDALAVDLPERPAHEEEPWDAVADPHAVLNAFGDRQVIDALQRLPEEIRWTVLLADVSQLDHKEVAEVLGIPIGTVKSRVFRGRQMLREALLPLAREMRLA